MKAINLLVLRCRDLEASRHFYETFDLRFSLHAHGSGPRHYAHEDETGVFELSPASNAAGDKTALGFHCPSLDEMSGRLAAAGYETQPIRENPWGRTLVV